MFNTLFGTKPLKCSNYIYMMLMSQQHLMQYFMISICNLTLQRKKSWPYEEICIWGERFFNLQYLSKNYIYSAHRFFRVQVQISW